MDFRCSADLDHDRVRSLFEEHSQPFRVDGLVVRVRYSRGADFSGTCFYRDARIFVNLGRHLRFPYAFGTHIAKARPHRLGWSREILRMTVFDAYQLALFIYLHELYHYLLMLSGRSPRRREAMCDRFAARVLVDAFQCPVRDARGNLVPRGRWDFQDLQTFVAAAPRAAAVPRLRPPIPVRVRGAS